MKYIILLLDGAADEKIAELDNKTVFEASNTPNMDRLAKHSMIGMVKTVPDGFSPGSDTANLSVLGYDPNKYYSGRSPLEALSIGVKMNNSDVAMRMNFVTLSDNEGGFANQTIIDHSAGELSTSEAAVLLQDIKKEFENETYNFYLGTSYRHLLIWHDGKVLPLVQPHDILTQNVADKLPQDKTLADMMVKSFDILWNHRINIERKEKGLNPANCIWFWGAGTKPDLISFTKKTNLKGAMISAVDLLKGIATGANMDVIEVEGANGGLHTNYKGKEEAAIDALLNKDKDFVYIHVEAPDEMGHQGKILDKVKAVENIDEYILGPLVDTLDKENTDYRILVMPDHPTPVRIRTHTSDPVPFMLYDSTKDYNSNILYNESSAENSGIYYESGPELANKLFEIE